MGKVTGFLEYERDLPSDRSPEERIHDWHEFHSQFPTERLQTQAARCMDCGTPFCHTGMLLGGVTSGCPLNNLVPEWNDLVYRGLWQQALDRLHKTNNFPEFTGRVCPAPCEGSCVLGVNQPPVTIKNLENAIIETGFERGWVMPEKPPRRTDKRVAVVGSGPAGLACAAQLNRVGHTVTVFEREDRIGGLLTYGIPNMKLGKEIVQRRVDILIEEGIRFVTGTEVGVDYPADRLMVEFDAVVLCGGATKPRDLPVEGRELAGIHFAVDYLTLSTKNLLDGTATQASDARDGMHATGKNVIVIGGGDTGTDCVGTALRQGCKSLAQFEILDRPPDERLPNNPWPEWPRIYRLDYGQEEALALFGRDPRFYNIMTKRFEGDEQGRVKAIHTVQIEWIKGNNGSRPSPREIPGTEKAWPAEMVLLSMGFLGPEDTLLDQLGIARDERSNVKATHGQFETNVEGVFAAGDMRRGQSLVVWAIEEGRAAARACDAYLMGSAELP